MKRIFIRTLFTILLLVALSQTAFAAESISVVMNGGKATYSAGYVIAAAGQVANSGEAMPNRDVFIQIFDSTNNPVYYTSTETNAGGYYMTAFTVPSNFHDLSYTLKVSTAQASAQKSFLLGSATHELSLSGINPVGSTTTPTTVIPIDTKTVALAFNVNVNYFYNSSGGLANGVIGLNENNEDCIKLYKGTDKKRVSFDLDLISDPAAGFSSTSYYSPTSGQLITAPKSQCCLVLKLGESLVADTLYAIKIDGNLCSNNGSKLGTDQVIYFKTASESGSSKPTPVITPTTTAPNTANMAASIAALPPATAAADVGMTVTSGNTATVQIDTAKASALLKNANTSALFIDVSAVAATGVQKAVQLASSVVDLAKTENKPIAIQDGGLIMMIPPEVLVSGKDMTFSTTQVSNQTVTAAPTQMDNKAVYSFNATSDGNAFHSFNTAVTISLPIPEGVTDVEKLGVYYLDETTNTWNYMGGRIIDGKLVFTTNHFSTYMVAESNKTFTDISNHWAKNAIEVMVARNIVSGVSAVQFAPQSSITRAQFAAMLSRALGLTSSTGSAIFTDVASGSWYTSDVIKAANAGIIFGANQKFRPNDNITRQEMAVMIVRAYKYAGGTVDSQKVLEFSDNSKIASWAVDSVVDAHSLGIINGNADGSFGALKNATRAEGAVMLKSFMDKLGI